MCIPVGTVSLEDCDLLTSSLAFINCSPSPMSNPFKTCARLAITSFTFMLLCVPEPVCQITNGNSSASLPARISSQTAEMASRFSVGEKLWKIQKKKKQKKNKKNQFKNNFKKKKDS